MEGIIKKSLKFMTEGLPPGALEGCREGFGAGGGARGGGGAATAASMEDDDFDPQPELAGREEAGAAESAGKSRARLN